jgi:hypothetical protein
MAPRCVRNFWIELDVDGKKERIATGPRARSGGFIMYIKMRNRGDVEKVLTLYGREVNGQLRLSASKPDGTDYFTIAMDQD